MADPFGIIGLLGVSAKIVTTIVKLGLDWKDAPTDAQSFKGELQALKTILSETSTNVLLNPNFQDAFQGHPSSLLSQLRPPTSAGEDDDAGCADTESLVSACRVELDKLLVDLSRRVEGGRFGWERIKGAFKAKETRESVQALSRQCSLLNSLLTIDSITLLTDVVAQLRDVEAKQAVRHEEQRGLSLAIRGRIDSMAARQRKGEDEEERRKILEWLTPIEFASTQSDFIRRRTPETGGALLKSPEYEAWVGSPGGSVLFCPGIPGAGKTMSSAIVIDDLLHREFLGSDDVAVAWLYCNFKRQDEQKLDALLLSLLRQLASTCSETPSVVSKLHRVCVERGIRPSTAEILSALQTVCSNLEKVIFVIDALDECQIADKCRAQLMDAVLGLAAKGNVNVFATARFIPDVMRSFSDKGAATMEIKATPEDVRMYLAAEMGELPGFVRRSPALQEQIITAIVDAVDGMFLLAALHLKSLVGKRSPGAIKTALVQLPSGSDAYDKAYREAMVRIEGQVYDLEHLAKEVLTWITCAERPLQTEELQHALSVTPGDQDFDPDSLPDIEDMVACCAGLVVIDDDSNIIRLVHYTTQEFFERTSWEWFPKAQLHIAEACITYISFSSFATGPCETESELKERLGTYKLYEYGALNWGHHCRKSVDVNNTILDFLTTTTSAFRDAATQIKFHDINKRYEFRAPRNIGGLHLTALFGISKAMETLIGDGYFVDTLDDWSMTPLFYTALTGDPETAKILLSSDIARVDIANKNGDSALMIALEHGHAPVARLLLSSGRADTKELRKNDKILPMSIRSGNMAVVQLLIDYGIDVNRGRRNKPIEIACFSKSLDSIKILLTAPNIQLSPAKDRSMLVLAILTGLDDFVDILLANDSIDVNAVGQRGLTPLGAAAEGHISNLTKLLAHPRIQPNLLCADDLSPLHIAISECNDEAVDILSAVIELSPELKLRTDNARLCGAVRKGDEMLVRQLLAKGASPNKFHKRIRGPLDCAILCRDEAAHIGVFKALLEDPRLDVNAPIIYGRDALSMTLSYEKLEMTKLLLERSDIRADAVDEVGRTHIYWCAAFDRPDAARMLLALPSEAGVDPNRGVKDQTKFPLFIAVQNRSFELVGLLLSDPRVDPDQGNCAGTTALCVAVRMRGQGDLVRLLMNHPKVNVNSRDKRGRTPLWWAVKDMLVDSIRLLLNRGADPNIPNLRGFTPLALAVREGQQTIVKILQEHGARQWTETDEWHALHWADHGRSVHTTNLLLDDEAIENSTDYYGLDRLFRSCCP